MKLLLEFSEFNYQRLNSDSVPQSTHVDDPRLSLGSYNRFLSNLTNSFNRLNHIFKSINKTTTGVSLKTGSRFNIRNIKNIKVIRIVPKNDIYYNIYLTFELEEVEYHGVIERINSLEPQFKSEFFKTTQYFITHEWGIRMRGNIIKAVKMWLIPEEGKYESLKDIRGIKKNTGEIIKIEKHSTVELIKSDHTHHSLIYNDEVVVLDGINYYYFNYYFRKTS
jgi:hypothetical protein